jgi:hypothetical protein
MAATSKSDASTEAKSDTVDTETPSAPQGENRSAPPDQPKPPGDLRRRASRAKRTGPFVKYVGAAALRSIDSTAWKSLNINLKDKDASHTWGVSNDKMVEASRFSDAQLDYLLIDDLQQGTGTHAFLLVDYDEDGQLVQAVYE